MQKNNYLGHSTLWYSQGVLLLDLMKYNMFNIANVNTLNKLKPRIENSLIAPKVRQKRYFCIQELLNGFHLETSKK